MNEWMNEWMFSLSVYHTLMLMDAMSIIGFFHITCKLYEVYLRVYLPLVLQSVKLEISFQLRHYSDCS